FIETHQVRTLPETILIVINPEGRVRGVHMLAFHEPPEYGPSVDPNDDLAPSEGSVDVDVEQRPWEPIAGSDDGVPLVAFVDGVRRIDARLVLDDPEAGPIPGICGSYGVGAVVWDRERRRSEVVGASIHRLGVLAKGRIAEIPPGGPALTYEVESVADDDPGSLMGHFHSRMRRSESELAEKLGAGGHFVVADGPLYELSPTETIGYVKSHRVNYLANGHGEIIGRLAPGERTPLFTIKGYERYSWYLRLAEVIGGHSWSGIVRCEAAAALPIEEVVVLADRSAAILPTVASEAHLDPRAPQNLIPIAALERHLRHLLGDAGLVLRHLRAAVMRMEAA
ncbi:MAG: hypothetical protein MUP76_08490, partial [Acidimicrobiia bacterium]|nr:hypothetical protein [Acidimicrobiia bacterium]